ncbi:MAG: PBECR4 domain-containing protein [Acetatifactor sp.]
MEQQISDKLRKTAEGFRSLLDTQYHIIIGRKGKSVELTVEFKPIDFHHLMGLGKLKNLRIATQNRESVFSGILNGTITYPSICRSRYIKQIENRFVPLAHIEQIFDDNKLIFRYNEKRNQFSLIEADYLLSAPFSGNDIYIFIEEKETEGLFFCRSFFPKERKDYTVGQPQFTLLFKEKITVSTGKKIIQYDRLSPKEKPADVSPAEHTEMQKAE